MEHEPFEDTFPIEHEEFSNERQGSFSGKSVQLQYLPKTSLRQLLNVRPWNLR